MTLNYRCLNLSHQYDQREVLRVHSLHLQPAQFTAIVGPNGAGKSTLLSILAGLRPNYDGSCILGDDEITRWRRRTLARTVSFLPQKIDLSFPFTAGQVVLMGRTPHAETFFESPEDLKAAAEAMALTDTAQFQDRDYRSLSGGERQRVLLASALAQSTPVLLLDEPATFLDLRHQLSTYRLLQNLATEGRIVVAVTHDLNLAASFAHRIIVLSCGTIAADGAPKEALRPEILEKVFQVNPTEVPWIYHA